MSSIFEGFLSTSEVLEAFSDRQFLAAMLRFEAALARAQAAAGVIPASAAQSIAGTCKVDLFDVAKIVRESARAGSLAIPLVSSLREVVGLFNPSAAAHVHQGCTSQDAIDTALVLVTRDALALIRADVRRSADVLLDLAAAHAATPVLARTLMQPASITSFGFKCAGWAAPLLRAVERIDEAASRALQLQLGGVVGTLSHLGAQPQRVRALMAADLGLREPAAAWHSQRDEWVALGCELGLLAGSLGKIARDIALMSQAEVDEVAEPVEPGRGGPQNRPPKHNAVASMVALAAAQRVPQRVAALLAAMPQEHERALGAWQAELAEWPLLVMAVHGSARAMAQMLPGLQVRPARMLANIDGVRRGVPADMAAHWFDPGLVREAERETLAQLARLHVRA